MSFLVLMTCRYLISDPLIPNTPLSMIDMAWLFVCSFVHLFVYLCYVENQSILLLSIHS